MLLQNAAFVPLFRKTLNNRARQVKVDDFEAKAAQRTKAGRSRRDLRRRRNDRMLAASKALGYLKQTGRPNDLMDTARRLVFLKGNDAHDYKFSAAVLEDYYSFAPAMRNRYLAGAMFYLPTSEAKDNALVGRIRAAFA